VVLQNKMMHQRISSEHELAVAGYFDAMSEASEICVELLKNIKSTQTNYQSMDNFLASMSEDGATASTSAGAPHAVNPFCTKRSNFRQIHDKYSSVFRSIRSSHTKVARKLKVMKAVRKLFKTCHVVARDAAAAHLMFFGLASGPANALRKEMTMQSSMAGSLQRLRDQLDAAAKGTYVVGKQLDTLSQLVARLSDAIDRENAMVMCCLERAGVGSSVVEILTELKKSYLSSSRLAEELEEHVCMCLSTVHRSRAFVI
jgi:hypothetical protein